MKGFARLMLPVFIGLAVPVLLAAGTVFPYPFAPSEGYTNVLERPYRDEICLNGYWDFQAVPVPGDWERGHGKAPVLAPPSGEWDEVRIKIPSPWNVNDFASHRLEGPDHRDYPSYPAAWCGVKMAWMRKMVQVPSQWAGDRVILHFEAVAGYAEVYAGGKKVAENFDLFLPFEADVTEVSVPGQELEILVGVRSQQLFEDTSGVGRRVIPAGSMWGTHINGIWQDVYLLRRPAVRVEDVQVLPEVSKGTLSLKIRLRNDSGSDASLKLTGTVQEWINHAGTDVISAPVPAWELGVQALEIPSRKVKIPAGGTVETTVSMDARTLRTWTPEHPDLYGLRLYLSKGKKTVDCQYIRFGWREWTLEGDKLCLNGRPYPLRGDSWHFMGIPQLTRRYVWAWYFAIKGMNGNAVRLHAQVYPRLYLEMADEMGICVLDETANWASDGGPALENPAFWEHSKDHLRRMVLRDRNYPSVFGWSVSNENKPVILHVHRRPDLMPLQEQAWRDWVAIVRETDPTRPWISSDGEEDGEGILPVTVGHYGDAGSMRSWKGLGKPWGVGEHGMAYYGTPQEVAKYNGERAYESVEGRMEGLALESYNLLKDMRSSGASYSTVFNMAWYALKPLPLGKQDLTSDMTLEDGIVFGPYVEGVPGVQPERLGPYGTTFNPGYDPALPLWETWPMYDAMRAANAPDGAAWSPWAEAQDPVLYEPTEAVPYDRVVYIGAPDSRLAHILAAQGVILSDKAKGRTLYIVDASSAWALPGTDGADVWVWGLTPDAARKYSLNVTLEPLRRSSFLPKQRSWTRGMRNSDFYFCEVQSAHAARFTLSGPMVEEGEVLLEACRTDWRSWNKRPEEMKTASVLRSEYECTAALPVMVRNGNLVLSTLDDFLSSEKGYNTLHTLLQHAGVPMRPVESGSFEAFDDGIYLPGILTRPVK